MGSRIKFIYWIFIEFLYTILECLSVDQNQTSNFIYFLKILDVVCMQMQRTCSELDILLTFDADFFFRFEVSIKHEFLTLKMNFLWFDLVYGHFSIIVDCCNSSLLMELSIGALGWTGKRWSWYSIKIRFFEWFARCIFRFETGVYVWLILIKKKTKHIW